MCGGLNITLEGTLTIYPHREGDPVVLPKVCNKCIHRELLFYNLFFLDGLSHAVFAVEVDNRVVNQRVTLSSQQQLNWG